jgi:hypothetical protein
MREVWKPYLENQEREKYCEFVFPVVIAPVCSATGNIVVGNTAPYALSKMQVAITFQS